MFTIKTNHCSTHCFVLNGLMKRLVSLFRYNFTKFGFLKFSKIMVRLVGVGLITGLWGSTVIKLIVNCEQLWTQRDS